MVGNRLAVCDLYGYGAAVTDTGFVVFHLNECIAAAQAAHAKGEVEERFSRTVVALSGDVSVLDFSSLVCLSMTARSLPCCAASHVPDDGHLVLPCRAGMVTRRRHVSKLCILVEQKENHRGGSLGAAIS